MPGPPPWLSGLLGAPPGRGHRPPRARRGDVRSAILDVLAAESMNGYQVIQQIAERTSGAWKPSPGSVYPTVQQLEDEGLVEASVAGTGRSYALTSAGRALVAEQREQLGRPWERVDGSGGPARELMGTARQVMLAARQVLLAGSESQVARATAILVETRRALYGVLAEGDAPTHG